MKKYLGEGYRSIAYLTEDNYIILKGKNEKAYATYKNDFDVLNKLKKYIKAVLIPNDVSLINKDIKYPFGGLKYKQIDGEVFDILKKDTYDLNSIAFKLGSFLNELHSIPEMFNKEKIVFQEKSRVEMNIKLIAKYIDFKYIEKINSFKKEYYKELESYNNYALVHGDLWYENYIISKDGKTLNGIIDFQDFCIFIREYDLVPLLYIGKEFMEQVIKNYKYKVNLRLIELLFIRREIVSFEYMLEYAREDLEEQLEKIIDKLNKYI